MKKNKSKVESEKRDNAQVMIFRANEDRELPAHLTMDDEMTFGQQYHPVLAAIDGPVVRPFSRAEILKAFAKPDIAEAKKELKKGFHPTLLIDLESGAVLIEMRKHTPSEFPETPPAFERYRAASFDTSNKLHALKEAILREVDAFQQAHTPASKKTKRVKK